MSENEANGAPSATAVSGSETPNPGVQKRKYSTADEDLITYSWKDVDVWVGRKGIEKAMTTGKVAPAHENLDGRTVIDAKWESESKMPHNRASVINMPEDPKKQGCCEKNRKPAKHLVKNVSGMVRPGELVALMGSSGAGKTTLLNVLTFRSGPQLHVTGDRYINGIPVGPKEVSAVSAYIQQEDLFFGTLTVYEHLVFYSHLRMDKKYTRQQRSDKVIQVMDEFGLTKCKDVMIGVHGRIKGISGGEMKRLAFASEVMNDPPLMFCDEPTSGLDSYMAETVVTVMKVLASRGKTIICTIHQPSSQVFNLFDRILLLAEGRVAFLGPIPEAVKFFAENGHICPPNFNPSDYFAHTLAIIPGRVEECKEFVNEICDKFQETPSYQEVVKALQTPVINEEYRKKMDVYKRKSPYKANWFQQFRIVLWRSWISQIHDWMIIVIRLLQIVGLGLIIGAVFFDTPVDPTNMEYKRVSDVAGVLYLLLTNISFLNMFAVLDGFLNEVPIFLREHYNGMYRVDVYFMCKGLADLPFFFLYPIIFHCITYFMIQFQMEFEPFFKQMLVIILVAQVASSFAYFLSCVCKDLTQAITIGPGMLIPLMLFSGFFITIPNMKGWNSWIIYISWFYYADECMMTNQLSTVTKIDCRFSANPDLEFHKQMGTQPFFQCTPFFTGTTLLKNYEFTKDHYWRNIGVLCTFMIGLRFIAYGALLLKTIRKR